VVDEDDDDFECVRTGCSSSPRRDFHHGRYRDVGIASNATTDDDVVVHADVDVDADALTRAFSTLMDGSRAWLQERKQ